MGRVLFVGIVLGAIFGVLSPWSSEAVEAIEWIGMVALRAIIGGLALGGIVFVLWVVPALLANGLAWILDRVVDNSTDPV